MCCVYSTVIKKRLRERAEQAQWDRNAVLVVQVVITTPGTVPSGYRRGILGIALVDSFAGERNNIQNFRDVKNDRGRSNRPREGVH
jgi:hypothetical protein